MTSTCDLVTERIALGEPLGELAEHAASCSRCQRLVALPVELGKAHHVVDPGIGFAARMTAGAQRRIVVRQRRRVVGGLAAASLVAVLGVFAVTHEPRSTVATTPDRDPDPDHRPATNPTPDRNHHDRDPWKPRDHHAVDPDVASLVHLANVDRASHLSARWHRIEKSLAPYAALLKETTP
jgi:hypothetical protein